MFSDKLKKVLKKEKVSLKELAEEMGRQPQTFYNLTHKEGTETKSGNVLTINYNSAEQMLDALGYDLVFRNRETGEIID